jgi:hypothetical protein
MAVAAIERNQAISQEPGLGLGQPLGGAALRLDLPAGMGHQLGPFGLPVPIGTRPEAGHVEGSHIEGDA